MNLGGSEKEHEEDPERLIYAYASHIPVPKWDDKNAKTAPKECFHCNQKFSSGHQHNCRLCGHLFCSQCTAKFYLPYVFEKKPKQGPTRVCIECRDKCLVERIKEIWEKEKTQSKIKGRNADKEKIEKDRQIWGYLLPLIQYNLDGIKREIEVAVPKEWDDINFYEECKKCHRKGGGLGNLGKAHNCRTCGKLYCDKCTSKLTIPAFFDKKGKSGPARVCDNCRFVIIGGAKLVERPTLPPLIPEDANDSDGNFSTSSTLSKIESNSGSLQQRTCAVAGCGLPRVTKTGYCAQHANEAASNSETGGGGLFSGNVNRDLMITVTWEGDRDPIGKILITDENMSLLQIDNFFRKMQPNVDSFSYIYRGEVIPEAFFEVFLSKHFGKNVYIRKKLSKAFLAAAGISEDDALSPPPSPPLSDDNSNSEDRGSSAAEKKEKLTNNPFKRAEADKIAIEQKKKEDDEDKKRREIGQFKRPMAFKQPNVIHTSTSNEALNNIGSNNSSTASTPTPGASGDDPFKARAKMFGAK